jgi:hypothetical protein
MSVLLRHAPLRRTQMVLGLVLMGLVFAPSAFAAGQLDTVIATGSGGIFTNVNISAQSGTSGQNPSGTVSVTVSNFLTFTGSVTCLSVIGPDHGGGSSGTPTTAVISAVGTLGNLPNLPFKFVLVDNGGGGADTPGDEPGAGSPTDCSLPSPEFVFDLTPLTHGRAVVFDAPVLPTSKEQCKNGGWRNFSQFKNQGDCVSFVATNGKNQPG